MSALPYVYFIELAPFPPLRTAEGEKSTFVAQPKFPKSRQEQSEGQN